MRIRILLVLAVALVVTAPPARAADHVRPGGDAKASVSVGGPVNINTADAKELAKLDGIGHALAEKIIDYRQKNGPFQKPEDLRKVSGVGRGLWERNRDRIVVK
jgi:competence protein ComEA